MAYLKDIIIDCQQSGCIKQARKEVFDRWNGSCGKYCSAHAKQKLQELKRLEPISHPDPLRHGGI